jgi:hypothetical protein
VLLFKAAEMPIHSRYNHIVTWVSHLAHHSGKGPISQWGLSLSVFFCLSLSCASETHRGKALRLGTCMDLATH